MLLSDTEVSASDTLSQPFAPVAGISVSPRHFSSYYARQQGCFRPPRSGPAADDPAVTQRQVTAEMDEASSIRQSQEYLSACLGRVFCSECLFGPKVAALVCFTVFSISL